MFASILYTFINQEIGIQIVTLIQITEHFRLVLSTNYLICYISIFCNLN